MCPPDGCAVDSWYREVLSARRCSHRPRATPARAGCDRVIGEPHVLRRVAPRELRGPRDPPSKALLPAPRTHRLANGQSPSPQGGRQCFAVVSPRSRNVRVLLPVRDCGRQGCRRVGSNPVMLRCGPASGGSRPRSRVVRCCTVVAFASPNPPSAARYSGARAKVKLPPVEEKREIRRSAEDRFVRLSRPVLCACWPAFRVAGDTRDVRSSYGNVCRTQWPTFGYCQRLSLR